MSFKYGNNRLAVIAEPTFEYRRIGVDRFSTVSITEMRLSIPILFQFYPSSLFWVSYNKRRIEKRIQKAQEKSAEKGDKVRKKYKRWWDRNQKAYEVVGVQIGIPIPSSTTVHYNYIDGNFIDTSISMSDVKNMKRADVDVDLIVGGGYMFTPNFGLELRYAFSVIEPIKIANAYPTYIVSAGLRMMYYF